VIEQIWNYIGRCNKYINDTEPWKQVDPERLGTILYTSIEHLRIISILIWPIIPGSAEKLACQIGQPIGKLKDAKFKKTTKGEVIGPEILFKKQEKIIEDAFSKLNLKIGHIKQVEPHPNADKLYLLTLDVGTDETRQLVAGMKPFYKIEELVGKHIVFVSNLKPANIRGIQSNGMMLAAEKEGVVKVLEAPDAHAGDQVAVEGITPKTAQITIDDFQKIKLTTKDKTAIYNDKPLKTHKGKVIVDMPDSSKIR